MTGDDEGDAVPPTAAGLPVVPTSPVIPSYERQGVPEDDAAEPPDADHADGEG